MVVRNWDPRYKKASNLSQPETFFIKFKQVVDLKPAHENEVYFYFEKSEKH